MGKALETPDKRTRGEGHKVSLVDVVETQPAEEQQIATVVKDTEPSDGRPSSSSSWEGDRAIVVGHIAHYLKRQRLTFIAATG